MKISYLSTEFREAIDMKKVEMNQQQLKKLEINELSKEVVEVEKIID